MSVLLLFFGDSEPTVPDSPLAIDVGSSFDVAGSVSNSFEQFPMDISAEGASEAKAEFFTNTMAIGTSSHPRARMLFSTEDTLSILAASSSAIRVAFAPEPAIDISVLSGGVLRIKFLGANSASLFDIAATSGIKSRLEFVQGIDQGDPVFAGQDKQLEYIPFII